MKLEEQLICDMPATALLVPCRADASGMRVSHCVAVRRYVLTSPAAVVIAERFARRAFWEEAARAGCWDGGADEVSLRSRLAPNTQFLVLAPGLLVHERTACRFTGAQSAHLQMCAPAYDSAGGCRLQRRRQAHRAALLHCTG